jgi:hypothetical protein
MMLDLSPIRPADIAAAALLARDVRMSMAEQLYRAVLTASAMPSGRPAGAVSPALAALMAQGGSEVDDGVEPERPAAGAGHPRFVPTARDVSTFQDTLALLAGWGVHDIDLTRQHPRLARLQADAQTKGRLVAETQTRLETFLAGKVACAADRIADVTQRLSAEHKVARAAHAKALDALRAAGRDSRQQVLVTGRMCMGVLKGAGLHWWLGGGGLTLPQWEWAARWGAVPGDSPRHRQAQARRVHDHAISFALVRDARRRDQKARTGAAR